ncbi:hypothetical protein RIR_e71816_A0A2N0RRW9_9GLOM [Rhizophagus irregularis DAOM 181602=DAOM 197198]|nr:hypothetical protein RIR_e71816_A0A2N0RRW9_9GLOM [Rhizophagus irregularis DAOM 181602=DAOM 197198]
MLKYMRNGFRCILAFGVKCDANIGATFIWFCKSFGKCGRRKNSRDTFCFNDTLKKLKKSINILNFCSRILFSRSDNNNIIYLISR